MVTRGPQAPKNVKQNKDFGDATAQRTGTGIDSDAIGAAAVGGECGLKILYMTTRRT